MFLKGTRPLRFCKDSLMIPSVSAGRKNYQTRREADGSLREVGNKNVMAETKCRGTIWKYNTSNTEPRSEKHQHPATFPDVLAADLIRCFSQPSDIVLDPMCGSGTTCVQAKKLGRQYLGIEINAEYVEIARRLVDGVNGPVHPLLRLAQAEKDPVRRAMLIRSYTKAKAAGIAQ